MALAPAQYNDRCAVDTVGERSHCEACDCEDIISHPPTMGGLLLGCHLTTGWVESS